MEELEQKLYSLLIGEESIPNRLNLKEEVSKNEIEELIQVTNAVIEKYKDKNFVPKTIALCFVDIYNQFSFREDFYPIKKLQYFEDIGIRIQELAYELFEE